MFETRTIPEARALVLLKRAFKIVVSVYLVIGMIAAYRAFYQVHSLDLDSPDTLQSGSTIKASVVSYARTNVTVRIELVQDAHSQPIAMQLLRCNEWALLDPRTRAASHAVVLTDDVLSRFMNGKAMVRATAIGGPQWGRTPPPMIRERVVNIQRD